MRTFVLGKDTGPTPSMQKILDVAQKCEIVVESISYEHPYGGQEMSGPWGGWVVKTFSGVIVGLTLEDVLKKIRERKKSE